MMHVHCRQSLYFLRSSSTEQKGIATWCVRIQLQQWWIGTSNYVVVYLHNNAISSILYNNIPFPGLGYSLPFLHPGTFAKAFLCLFSVPLLNDVM